MCFLALGFQFRLARSTRSEPFFVETTLTKPNLAWQALAKTLTRQNGALSGLLYVCFMYACPQVLVIIVLPCNIVAWTTIKPVHRPALPWHEVPVLQLPHMPGPGAISAGHFTISASHNGATVVKCTVHLHSLREIFNVEPTLTPPNQKTCGSNRPQRQYFKWTRHPRWRWFSKMGYRRSPWMV